MSSGDLARIAGGTFRMGSDRHYPEEAAAHRVAVDAFWIDCHPVTNRQFREFVTATGNVTPAEIPPDPKDYPDALPHLIYSGLAGVYSARRPGRFARQEPVMDASKASRLASSLWRKQQHQWARRPSGRSYRV